MTLEEYKKTQAETKAALAAKFNLAKAEKKVEADKEIASMKEVEKPDLDAVFFVGKTSSEKAKAKAKAETKKKELLETGFVCGEPARSEGGRGGGRGAGAGRGGAGRGGGRGYAGANINLTDSS